MNRERLTLARINAFGCPPGKSQAFLWDTTSPRLAVRVTAGGAKAFIFEAKLNRVTIRRTIGDARAWLLEDARSEANRLQTLIDQGIDPREQDREKALAKAAKKTAAEAAARQAEERKRYTLQALCEAYVEHLKASGKAKSAGATRSAFKCHVFEPHPSIAAAPPREITAYQIATIIRTVLESGKERTAGILRSYLSAAFNAARRAPFDARLPAALIQFGIEANPVAPVAPIAVRAGKRTLSPDELKAYLASLTSEVADLTLKVALFAGGQRMAQLLRAQLSDYDDSQQALRLWDAKGKRSTAREHVLPLGPVAASLIERLILRAKAIESPWIFTTSGKAPMAFTTPGKRIAEIAAQLSGEPFDLRDIRRTVETMLASMGISRDVRAQLLSHGITGVQATHYDRHSYMNEKRAALVAWEAHLSEIETGTRAVNVVKLPRKRKAAA